MIINNYIVTYLVCSVVSIFIGLVAAFNGFYVWKKWDINSQADEQYLLEKRVYLLITILSVGFFIRLLMAPLWFFSLHSMIISIPGAMCLVGVHNVNAPLSYIASALKLLLPALYGYWLILNFLDRQAESQPFMKQKLLFIAPLGILILLETILDISFFFSNPPRQVSCCTSLFDVPTDNIPSVVSQSTWIWLIIFYILILFILGEILHFFIGQKRSLSSGNKWWFGNKTLMLFETLVTTFAFIVFILALHTKISPLFLGLPFHHCVFCLGQEVWDALLFFAMIFIGLTLFIIYFWVVCSKNYRNVNLILNKYMVKLLKWSGFMVAGELAVLSLHLALAL
ncbi:hypothetical protein [Desulfobacterium sp. N47]|uniref:Uncharacterized protein n=1 Tax=uncultured Desulfobacterium sp. TaxID=201089 RepID=E1YET8_9BACT|nr:hypothetical protein N47_J00630 [uncultured Desulfobacterium sp.]